MAVRARRRCRLRPAPLGLYWSAGAGDELSLDAVVLGGLLAGYLAEGRRGDAAVAGGRAGLIGGLPAVWVLAGDVVPAVAAAGPAWFRGMATLLAVGVAVVVLAFAGLAGAVGGRVGGWLAEKRGHGRVPSAS